MIGVKKKNRVKIEIEMGLWGGKVGRLPITGPGT